MFKMLGWYLSFGAIFASIFTYPPLWKSIAIRFGASNIFLIGIILLLASTPVHGILTNIFVKFRHPALKFIGGFLFGISIALISGSIIVWLNLPIPI